MLNYSIFSVIVIILLAIFFLIFPLILYYKKHKKFAYVLLGVYFLFFVYWKFYYKNAFFNLNYPDTIKIQKIEINYKSYNFDAQEQKIAQLDAVTYKTNNKINIYFQTNGMNYVLSKNFQSTSSNCFGEIIFNINSIQKVECESIQ